MSKTPTVSETPTITETPTIMLTPTATGVLADPRSEAQGATEPAPEPLQNATYLYDGDGNLVKSDVNLDNTGAGIRETYYLGNPGPKAAGEAPLVI